MRGEGKWAQGRAPSPKKGRCALWVTLQERALNKFPFMSMGAERECHACVTSDHTFDGLGTRNSIMIIY